MSCVMATVLKAYVICVCRLFGMAGDGPGCGGDAAAPPRPQVVTHNTHMHIHIHTFTPSHHMHSTLIFAFRPSHYRHICRFSLPPSLPPPSLPTTHTPSLLLCPRRLALLSFLTRLQDQLLALPSTDRPTHPLQVTALAIRLALVNIFERLGLSKKSLYLMRG